MHVKVGDTVKVISGHDKGKVGEISRIFKHNSTVIVRDINLKTKHMKSREQGEPGQIVKVRAEPPFTPTPATLFLCRRMVQSLFYVETSYSCSACRIRAMHGLSNYGKFVHIWLPT